jgi:hypothetical protein
MNYDNLTPTEKMILLALQLHPEMTIDALMALTGTETRKYMARTLRTLILCSKIERVENSGSVTYRMVR